MIASRVQINYLHMSSDEENGQAIYDDDDSNEDYRNSIMSGRNSYNVGSTTEEPTFSDPKSEEKPHQQEEQQHPQTATEATEEKEKDVNEYEDPAQTGSTRFHKKEEPSAIQSYDQSTYQVLLASQAQPGTHIIISEPTQQEDPTLKSIRPEDLIEESVHQNESANEQIFNATAEEIQEVEALAHQEEHLGQKQKDELQETAKQHHAEQATVQEAQAVESQQQVPEEPLTQAEVVSQPVEHRTEATVEPEPQDIIEEIEKKEEQVQENAQLNTEEEVRQATEEIIEPSRFIATAQQEIVQQVVAEQKPPQVEDHRLGSQVPDEVAQFVKVEQIEVPQTNEQRQPEHVYAEPIQQEELPVQQQPSNEQADPITQQHEAHEEAPLQHPQQTYEQVQHYRQQQEYLHEVEEYVHHQVEHNQQQQIVSHQPQESQHNDREQIPTHQEQVPNPHHNQVLAQQEQVHHSPEMPPLHHGGEDENYHRHAQQYPPSNSSPVVEQIHEQLPVNHEQQVPQHQEQVNLEQTHQSSKQYQVHPSPPSSSAAQAPSQSVSEFPRKKKDKQIENFEHATNNLQYKQEVQARQENREAQVNIEAEEAQRQKETQVHAQVEREDHHEKEYNEPSPIVVTVKPTSHPLSARQQKVSEKPDALVEQQRQNAPLVESKQSEPQEDIGAAGKTPIQRQQVIESSEARVIRVEPVRIEDERILARQPVTNELKRSIPAPSRQNVPLTEKPAAANSETCKCLIM